MMDIKKAIDVLTTLRCRGFINEENAEALDVALYVLDAQIEQQETD